VVIRADMIPDEVVRAALLTDERLGMREVILAAINAWPGMIDIPAGEFDGEQYPRIIHRPLTQEASDE